MFISKLSIVSLAFFLYFQVSADEQCSLCGQLMGMSEFLLATISQSVPTFFKLQNEKYCLKRIGDYTIVNDVLVYPYWGRGGMVDRGFFFPTSLPLDHHFPTLFILLPVLFTIIIPASCICHSPSITVSHSFQHHFPLPQLLIHAALKFGIPIPCTPSHIRIVFNFDQIIQYNLP